jgi:hypothetical protein
MKSLKKSSGISENTQPGNSNMQRSGHSDISDLSLDLETVKKISRKCSIQLEELSFREKFVNGRCIERTSQLSGLACFEPTFHCIPELVSEDTVREEIMSNNNWTKTFKNLLNNGEGKLNMSITDGQKEVNTYLSDVRLDKLDTLSRQMVESVVSQESNKLLPEGFNSLNY